LIGARARSAAGLLAVLVAAGRAGAQAPAPGSAPPAPPPGSPAIFKAAADLAAVLRTATPTAAGMTTSPVSITDQYRINIVHRSKPAAPLAHPGNTELHYIVDGAGTIVTGGTILRGQGAEATIQGGETRRLAKGDVVVIPANSPHWYSAVDGSITYLEVRWLAPAK
jgi:mannose-6-phosphate isomerase-like protein (cupin superfamily)